MESIISDKTHKRYNPLTGEWVLVSPHRTKRPWQGKMETPEVNNRPSHDPSCYLCPGNERAGGLKTEDYTETYVFKNDFAALLEDQGTEAFTDGLFQVQEERGLCKVICFSPNHALTMPEMSVDELQKVVKVWKREFEEIGNLPYISNVQIFENKGATMGCSNPHPHGQIWGQSSVPNEIAKRTQTQRAYFEKNGSSLLADYITQELKVNKRIVCENEHFVCLVPFWAIWPYETMIVSKRHFQAITDMTAAEELAFAQILQEITVKYDNLFQCSFPYSAGMQQRPTDGENHEGWHFHYSFYPPLLRSATVKKFMVGYEMFANPQRDITAEQAADKLREMSSVHYSKS